MESEVNFEYYVEHYTQMPECLYFFLLALGVLFVLFVGMYVYTIGKSHGLKGIEKKEFIRIEWHVLDERYYEMIFSGTSILFFMAVYYLINRFVTIDPYRANWDKYSDFYLMILIILSCIFNSFLDRVFVRFKFLNRDEKSAGRLTGMVYMILIFCYIKFIYKDDNYDMFITYFIGLMVGRFAYFDSTVHDFVKAIDGVRKNLSLMCFALGYTAIMCVYGFKSGYLLTHNGVITNIFITHLFMCAAIFVLHHIHIAELVTGRGTRTPKYKPEPQQRVRSEEMYAENLYEEDMYEESDMYDGDVDYEDEYEGDAYDNDDYGDEGYSGGAAVRYRTRNNN